MSPPQHVPLLGGGHGEATAVAGDNSSNSRSPGRSLEGAEGAALGGGGPRPRTARGRRSTADAPSTGLIADRLSAFHSDLLQYGGHQQPGGGGGQARSPG